MHIYIQNINTYTKSTGKFNLILYILYIWIGKFDFPMVLYFPMISISFGNHNLITIELNYFNQNDLLNDSLDVDCYF